MMRNICIEICQDFYIFLRDIFLFENNSFRIIILCCMYYVEILQILFKILFLNHVLIIQDDSYLFYVSYNCQGHI